MSEEVNKEQTKGAKQEKSTELTDDQLDEAAGGGENGEDLADGLAVRSRKRNAFEDISRSVGLG